MSTIDRVNSFAGHYTDWLWYGAWQGAIVVLIVMLFLKLFPRIPLALQYAVLLMALAKFMVPPMMALPVGLFSMWSVSGDTSVVEVTAREGSDIAIDRIGHQSAGAANSPSLQSQVGTDGHELIVADQSGGASAQAEGVTTSIVPVSVSYGLTWQSVALLIHLVGSAVFIAWIGLQMIRLRNLVISSQVCDVAALSKLGALPKGTLAKLDGIELRHGARVQGPMAYGLVCPTILVPSSLLEDDSPSLDSTLLHEIAHIRRKDLWMRWFEIVVQAVWWFHPLTWLLCRKISAVREDICDDYSIVNGTSNEHQYCQSLIDIAAQSTKASQSSLVCGILDGYSLTRRISRLMNVNRLRAQPLGILSLVAVVGIAVVLLPGVRRTVVAQEQRNPASDQTSIANTESEASEKPSASAPLVDGQKLNNNSAVIEMHLTTVRGTVRTESGVAVPDAVVIIGLTGARELRAKDNQGNEHVFKNEISRTTSDAQGHFEFIDLLVPCVLYEEGHPSRGPMAARLQLVAIPEEYGLTWCNQFQIRPMDEPKEGEVVVADKDILRVNDQIYYRGQTIDIELPCTTRVPLGGQLLDESGVPMSGVVARLGNVLQPTDNMNAEPNMRIFSHLAKTPLARLGNLECGLVPVELLKTTTDSQGRYRFDFVPLGAQVGLSFSHPRLVCPHFHVVQLKAFARTEIEVGPDGIYSPKMMTLRQVAVRALGSDGVTPVPNAKLAVISGGIAIASFYQHKSAATTDDSGIGTLELIPGDYKIQIVPPSNQPLWSANSQLHVTEDTKLQNVDFVLPKARLVKLRTLSDGKPLSFRVWYEYTLDDLQGGELKWHITGPDESIDEYGDVMATIPDNATAVRIAPMSLRPEQGDGHVIRLDGQSSQSLVFEVASLANSKERTSENRLPEKLRHGRYRYRMNNSLKKSDVSIEEIEKLISDIQANEPSEAMNALKGFFGVVKFSEKTLTQDGQRLRVDRNRSSGESLRNDLTIVDGPHFIDFGAFNKQCDIHYLEQSHIHVDSIESLLVLPTQTKSGKVTRQVEANGIAYQLQADETNLSEFRMPDDSFVVKRRIARPGTTRLECQLFPRAYDGIMMPTMVIKSDFQNGMMHRMEIVIFDEIKMLATVKSDSFAMSLPAGTGVFDYRSSGKELSQAHKYYSLRFDTFDVIKTLDESSSK